MSDTIERALRAQEALIGSGDSDLWQQACWAEQGAAQDFSNRRMDEGKAPIATAFGMIVQAGLLLRAIGNPNDRSYAIEQAQRYLADAISNGGREERG